MESGGCLMDKQSSGDQSSFHDSFMCHFSVTTGRAHHVGCINRSARQRRWPFEGIKWEQCGPFRVRGELIDPNHK